MAGGASEALAGARAVSAAAARQSINANQETSRVIIGSAAAAAILLPPRASASFI